MVICTHDLPEAEQLCDRVVVLEQGRVVAAGPPADLAAAHGGTGLSLEVPPTQVEAAVAAVAELVGDPPTVEPTGHVVVRPIARDDVPAIVRGLVERDVDVLEARRLVGTLEDVYLALHGRRGGAVATAPASTVTRPEEQP